MEAGLGEENALFMVRIRTARQIEGRALGGGNWSRAAA